jgi:hypothetical protein
MDINKHLATKRSEREKTDKAAHHLFEEFMKGWVKLDQKNWTVQAHAVGQGFFLYNRGGTVASVSCKEGMVVVGHSGAYDIGLEPPEAVHGVWPDWTAQVTPANLTKVTDHLTRHIVEMEARYG